VLIALIAAGAGAGAFFWQRGAHRSGAGAESSPPALPPPQPVFAYARKASVERGAAAFGVCTACHNADQGGVNGTGPNLWGAAGAAVAARADFAYSEALRRRGGRLDWPTLDAYLKRPIDFVPGTTMHFAGVRDPQRRADIVAYLNEQGGSLPRLYPPPAPPSAPVDANLGTAEEVQATENLAAPVPQAAVTEDQARQFALDYFDRWSRDNASALSWLEENYAPEVTYYGTARDRQAILREKTAFARRWPERRYEPEPGVRAVCQSSTCVLEGIVRYACRSAARKAIASGRAEFSLTVDFAAGRPVVTAESGRVLARSP
jgi:cytochrome c